VNGPSTVDERSVSAIAIPVTSEKVTPQGAPPPAPSVNKGQSSKGDAAAVLFTGFLGVCCAQTTRPPHDPKDYCYDCHDWFENEPTHYKKHQKKKK
jgi:hypothetical protein